MSEEKTPLTVEKAMQRLAPVTAALHELARWIEEPAWALAVTLRTDGSKDRPAPLSENGFATVRAEVIRLIEDCPFRETDPAVRRDLAARVFCYAWVSVDRAVQQDVVEHFDYLSKSTRIALDAMGDVPRRFDIPSFLALSSSGRALAIDPRLPTGRSFGALLAESIDKFIEFLDARRKQ